MSDREQSALAELPADLELNIAGETEPAATSLASAGGDITPEAEEKYQLHIFSQPGSFDRGILQAAGRFVSQAELDRATFRVRLQANGDLKKAKRLLAEVDAIEVADVVPPGDVPIESLQTI